MSITDKSPGTAVGDAVAAVIGKLNKSELWLAGGTFGVLLEKGDQLEPRTFWGLVIVNVVYTAGRSAHKSFEAWRDGQRAKAEAESNATAKLVEAQATNGRLRGERDAATAENVQLNQRLNDCNAAHRAAARPEH